MRFSNLCRKMRLRSIVQWIPLALSCLLLERLTRQNRQFKLSNYLATMRSKKDARPLVETSSISTKAERLRPKVQKIKQRDHPPPSTGTIVTGHEANEHPAMPRVAKNDKVQEYESSSFAGTIVTRHSGVDIYEYVCVASEKLDEMDSDDHVIRRNRIYSYNLEGTSIGHSVLKEAEWADWVTITKGKRLQDWEQDSKDYMVEEETLLVLNLWDNPAHCLTDQVFSIAVDIVRRQLQRNGTHNTFYPKYLRAGWGALPKYARPLDNWCCQLLNMMEIVSRVPVRPPPDLQPICFRKLVVPHHAEYRHPPDNPFMQQILETVQRMALNATHLDANVRQKEDLLIRGNAPILLYDRRGTDRRVLSNSQEIKQLIQEIYHAKVVLLGEEWNDIANENNVTVQASVYNSFPYIIAPHGAHLTNLLFARKGTQVMEVTCWIPHAPLPHGELFLNLSRKDEAATAEQWYGEASPFDDHKWFYNFTRRLGIEHFVYSEYDGCMENGDLNPMGSPEEITVDADRFVSFVGSRFNLKPRKRRGATVYNHISRD